MLQTLHVSKLMKYYTLGPAGITFVVDLIRDVLPSATTWWDIWQLEKMQQCSSDDFLRVPTLHLPGDQKYQYDTSYTVSHSGSHLIIHS